MFGNEYTGSGLSPTKTKAKLADVFRSRKKLGWNDSIFGYYNADRIS